MDAPQAVGRGDRGGRAAGVRGAESEAQVERALEVVGRLSRRIGARPHRRPETPFPGGALLAWSDEARAAEDRVRLDRPALTRRICTDLHLGCADEADALLSIELGWLGYAAPEATADVAALVPPDLTGLREREPLLKTPRWRRLRVAPPAPLVR